MPEFLSAMLNVELSFDMLIQASLPVRRGGLGVRRVVLLAPSSYLAASRAPVMPQTSQLRDVENSANAFSTCIKWACYHRHRPQGHKEYGQRLLQRAS